MLMWEEKNKCVSKINACLLIIISQVLKTTASAWLQGEIYRQHDQTKIPLQPLKQRDQVTGCALIEFLVLVTKEWTYYQNYWVCFDLMLHITGHEMKE